MHAYDDMNDRLTLLFDKHLAGRLTPDERMELMGLFLEPSLQPRLQQLVHDAWPAGEEHGLTGEKAESMMRHILDNGKAKTIAPAPRRSPLRLRRWAVAASVIVLLGAGGLWWKLNRKQEAATAVAVVRQDVPAPKTNKARITLADGRKVDLDSIANGQITLQGATRLVKLDNGQISYETVNGKLAAAIQYNTLENPRGSKVISMTLADGSRVWLNAGSSITYPVAFAGHDRQVTVNGEAYFDIVHDAKRPFYVSKNNLQVQVLGTQFNVNAYDDEPDARVTLLEGSVKVSLPAANDSRLPAPDSRLPPPDSRLPAPDSRLPAPDSRLLSPGQQAQVASDIKVLKDVDTDEVTAWKNGLFSFHGVSLEAMMRQIARWYDMKVTFKGTIPERRFGGKIYRDANISKVLEILEESNVHYQINGKEIIIMP